jgi:hypothetical protein
LRISCRYIVILQFPFTRAKTSSKEELDAEEKRVEDEARGRVEASTKGLFMVFNGI